MTNLTAEQVLDWISSRVLERESDLGYRVKAEVASLLAERDATLRGITAICDELDVRWSDQKFDTNIMSYTKRLRALPGIEGQAPTTEGKV